MSIALSLWMILFLVAFLLLAILLGVYVYRDAGRRGMNALLWTLVVIFVPSLIGLIIYLLVRGNYSDLRCPDCDTPITNQYAVCPRCGAKLRPACPACAMPVEPDWQVCPRCAQPLPKTQEDVHMPVRAKDRSLGKILAMIILIPALLIGIAVFCFTVAFGGGSASFQETTFEQYSRAMMEEGEYDKAEAVMTWYRGLPEKQEQAYALRYDHETENSNGHYFLLYVPGASHSHNHGFAQSSGLFGTTIKLEMSRTGQDGSFLQITSSAEKAPQLKIKLNGETIPCDVTVVDYNPTTFFIVPPYDGWEVEVYEESEVVVE